MVKKTENFVNEFTKIILTVIDYFNNRKLIKTNLFFSKKNI